MLSLLGSQKSTAAGHEFEILPVEEFGSDWIYLLFVLYDATSLHCAGSRFCAWMN